MQRGALLAVFSVCTAIAAALAAWVWWTDGTSHRHLIPAACEPSDKGIFGNVEWKVSRCRLLATQRTDVFVAAFFEREIKRTPFAFAADTEPITPTGSIVRRVRVIRSINYVPRHQWPPTKPAFEPDVAVSIDEKFSPEEIWQRLDSDTVNATFDALVDPYDYPEVIILSGLRRLGRYRDAAEFLKHPSMMRPAFSLDPIWRKRLAEEIRTLQRAPLSGSERKRLSESLAEVEEGGYWSPRQLMKSD